MTDSGFGINDVPEQANPPESTPIVLSTEATQSMRKAVESVMEIQDVTLGDKKQPLRIRGQLILPADQAFAQLRPLFERLGHTPGLRREEGLDVIRALPGVYSQRDRKIPWVNILMLVATILSVFYIGVQQELFVGIFQVIAHQVSGTLPGGVSPELFPTPAEFQQALLTGLLYTLSLLGILGAHEMGHYLMARRHGVDVTLPFFIPLPVSILGTMGAVIAMREPAPNRRIQFDIGIAGPLAGLVFAVPILVVGLLLSEVSTEQDIIAQMPESVQESMIFSHEGNSLAYLGIKYAIFGEILPNGDRDVFIHPVAFAAWAGFLVTALNLLPVGQLDGGHVLYGLFGDKARVLRWPIIIVLIGLAIIGSLNDAGLINMPFGWSGWWIWVLMLIFLVRSHAPVLDEITDLDPKRKALGVVMLVIFVLIFTPRPLVLDTEPVVSLLNSLM